MPKKEEILQEAMEAGQRGDLAHARELLQKLIDLDNREALYWLLMSTVVASREERIKCLTNVLALDPSNSAAKQDLQLLGASVPNNNNQPRKAKKEKKAPKAQLETSSPSTKKTSPKTEVWSVGSIVGGLALIVLGYIAASSSAFDNSRNVEIAVTSVQTATPLYVNTPHPNSEAFERGMQAYAVGNWQEAISGFEEHLVMEPASADAAYYLAMSHLELGETQSAKNAFERSLSIDNQFAPAYLGRALADMGLPNSDLRVLTDLNTAVLLDSNFTEAYLVRVRYYLNNEESSLALEDLTRAELLSPFSPQVHAHKALAYSTIGNYEVALPSAQLAYSLDASLLSNYPVLGKAYFEMGQADEAIEILQRYLTLEATDAEAWQQLGLSYLLKGEELNAVGAFDRAGGIDANLPEASYYRGLKDWESGNVDSALAFLNTAILAAPEWLEARLALAQVLLEKDNAEEAFFYINSSQELVENDAQQAAFLYWRAITLDTLGEEDSALLDWKELLELPAEIMPQEWRLTAEQRSAFR